VWIAQISDTHLRPEGVLYGDAVDPAAALAAAVRQIAALDPRPDLILHTGDVTEAGLPAEYVLARRLLEDLPAPLRAIPGNHDEGNTFREAFPDMPGLPTAGPLNYVDRETGPVRVIALDVTVPGQHHGEVSRHSLSWLEAVLAEEPDRPTVLMLHQPPFRCGVPYLDAYRCLDDGTLAALLLRFSAVERVLCGHVHRAMLRRFGGTLLCTAPSTVTAIALRPRPDAPPASYLEPPGFLLHHWDGEGMVTHVIPIGDFAGPLPFA
jgi:3',5'-cyclic-AMP phosphodiesterase